MRRTIFLIISCLTLTFMTLGCDNGKDIISASDMEEILYDYHLADGVASESDGGFDENIDAFRAAVLRKHGVSQELFDTSMVYYMRHTDELYTIYKRLSERMQEDARQLGANTSANMTSAGDSANVWNGERSLILMPYQPYNVYSFKIKTDTTFHKGDKIVLTFKSDFIFQDGSRDATAMLCIVLGNDSTVSRNSHMSSSLKSTLTLDDRDSLGIKEIRGFFTLSQGNDNVSSTTLKLMTLKDIELIRVHTKQPVSTQQASTKPDSLRHHPIKSDSLRELPLKPDSLRRLPLNRNHIKR